MTKPFAVFCVAAMVMTTLVSAEPGWNIIEESLWDRPTDPREVFNYASGVFSDYRWARSELQLTGRKGSSEYTVSPDVFSLNNTASGTATVATALGSEDQWMIFGNLGEETGYWATGAIRDENSLSGHSFEVSGNVVAGVPLVFDNENSLGEFESGLQVDANFLIVGNSDPSGPSAGSWWWTVQSLTNSAPWTATGGSMNVVTEDFTVVGVVRYDFETDWRKVKDDWNLVGAAWIVGVGGTNSEIIVKFITVDNSGVVTLDWSETVTGHGDLNGQTVSGVSVSDLPDGIWVSYYMKEGTDREYSLGSVMIRKHNLPDTLLVADAAVWDLEAYFTEDRSIEDPRVVSAAVGSILRTGLSTSLASAQNVIVWDVPNNPTTTLWWESGELLLRDQSDDRKLLCAQRGSSGTTCDAFGNTRTYMVGQLWREDVTGKPITGIRPTAACSRASKCDMLWVNAGEDRHWIVEYDTSISHRVVTWFTGGAIVVVLGVGVASARARRNSAGSVDTAAMKPAASSKKRPVQAAARLSASSKGKAGEASSLIPAPESSDAASRRSGGSKRRSGTNRKSTGSKRRSTGSKRRSTGSKRRSTGSKRSSTRASTGTSNAYDSGASGVSGVSTVSEGVVDEAPDASNFTSTATEASSESVE